jgi:hypothetical protein
MSDIEQLKQGKRYRKSGSLIQMTLDMAVRMWPTPSAMDGMRAGKADDPQEWLVRSKEKAKHGIRLHLPLNVAVKRWPTPTTQDFKGRGPNSRQQGLPDKVRRFPTPSAQMAKHANPTEWELENREKIQKQLHIEVGGQLNPDWVEWLMGWPIHWTSLEPLKKENFDDWLKKHSQKADTTDLRHIRIQATWWDNDPAEIPQCGSETVPRVANTIKNRIERLKALGNGQVPAVVAAIWRLLK